MITKKTLFYLAVIALCLLSILVYVKYYDDTFVQKNYEKHTGISNYIVDCQYSDNEQSYIKTVIRNQDKNDLKSKFHFVDNLEGMKGKVLCPFVSYSPLYEYCFIENQSGTYDYVLLAIEKDGNVLIVYEGYGN